MFEVVTMDVDLGDSIKWESEEGEKKVEDIYCHL